MFIFYTISFSVSFVLCLHSIWKRRWDDLSVYFVATSWMFLSLMYQMYWCKLVPLGFELVVR